MSNNESDWMKQQREMREREELDIRCERERIEEEIFYFATRLLKELNQMQILQSDNNHLIGQDFEVCWDADGVQINKYKKGE